MKVSFILIVSFSLFFQIKASALSSLQKSQIPSLDSDFTCIDSAKADQFISDFSIDIASFGGKELCNINVDTKKLFNDLQIIQDGQFSSDAQNNLIKGFIPANRYYEWMKSETRGVGRGNDIPFATAYNRGGYFTMQDGWAKLSTLGRVGVIVHEARHTEGYYHIPCTFGPYLNSSLNACDQNYTDGGSHAIEMEYYARVSEMGTNFHPVYQSMARLMAMGRANFVFNTSPLQKKSALVLLTNTNKLLFYTDGKVTERDNQIQNTYLLKATSFGASLFDGFFSWAIDIYKRTKESIAISDDYSYFKLLKQDRGQGQAPMVDLEEVDLGQRRYFVYLNQNGNMASYDFPNGKWGQLSQTPAKTMDGDNYFRTTLADGTEGLFIGHNTRLWQMNPNNMTFQRLRDWNPNYRSFAKIDNHLIALTSEGKVINKQTNQPIPELQNQNILQMVKVPVYDSFEVRE